MGCNKSQGMKWYSEWDLNPHCTDFKSVASANWAIGAYVRKVKVDLEPLFTQIFN